MKRQKHNESFGGYILQFVAKCLVVYMLFICVLFCKASTEDKSNSPQANRPLHIHLPREVTIKDGQPIKLGQVGIIYGQESLQDQASEITLGRISVPGQQVVIDKATVLSRLACNGVAASKIKLTGAEKVTIKQQDQIITGAQFVEFAASFLKKNPPAHSPCQFNPTLTPEDLFLPAASKDIKLSPHLLGARPENQATVQIDILADGRKIAVRQVTFLLKYNCLRAVTSVDIEAGQAITAENVTIEKTISSYPNPADWSPPYGLVTKSRLPANTVLSPSMTVPPMAAVVIKRNQNVIIRIDRPGLLVTAIGTAMQQAGAGEYIKVRNVDSKRIILAKVNEDGTVEPAF